MVNIIVKQVIVLPNWAPDCAHTGSRQVVTLPHCVVGVYI